jgi:hypothetical protein
MLNIDIIIKLTTKYNFKDMVLMCLENDIDFTEWYNEISEHAPDVVINYSPIEDKETSFYEIYPESCTFFIPSGIKNETIKFKGAFNFYKYFNKIVKFDFGNLSFEVKATKELKEHCYKNWCSNNEEVFFGIDYNAHGIVAESKESYYVDGDEITQKEYLDHKRGVLNKKLNKVNPKPKVIEKGDQEYVNYVSGNDDTLLAC